MPQSWPRRKVALRTLRRRSRNTFLHTFLSIAYVASCLLSPDASAPANANVLGDATGILGDATAIAFDPLKLGKASDNVLESVERIQSMLDQLNQLEGQTNTDLENRVNQVQGIVNSLEEDVDKNVANLAQIANQAEIQIAQLETQIFTDASALINKAQCALEVAASDQFQRLVADAIDNLNRAQPGITIFGIKIISFKAKEIKITDPDKAYIFTRDQYMDSLEKITATSPAYEIISTYANIIRLAKLASCSYQQPPLSGYFLQEEYEYLTRSSPWVTTITPTMQ